ncbi:MAG TPA: SGNH/GDSL hydrolase family protein [Jatrophihabitantaceae bacterium]
MSHRFRRPPVVVILAGAMGLALPIATAGGVVAATPRGAIRHDVIRHDAIRHDVIPYSAAPPVPARAASADWLGSWAAAPANADGGPDGSGYTDYTFRNEIHLSVGGDALRVRLSNAFGSAPLVIDHATVALAAGPASAAAKPGTVRSLTVSGRTRPTIARGAEAVSDPVALSVRAGADLLVSVYVAGRSGPVTFHPNANQRSYFSTGGDHSSDAGGAAFTQPTESWYYVDEVDVHSHAAGAVVALGDSITDGFRSTENANRRWPDALARRLDTAPSPAQLGVLNAGISANRVLLDGDAPQGPGTWAGVNAGARFDRDVLSRSGVRAVVIAEGINDLGQVPQQSDPAALIAGLHQLAVRAHAAGLQVVGGTLSPAPDYVGDRESTRLAVNTWIRHSSDFDAVADFDRALRDPHDPHRLAARFDSDDHLHPNDAGYQAMADAVPLAALYGSATQARAGWTGSWQAAAAWGEPGYDNDGYPGFTLRNELHLSVGGAQVRIRLSNLFGTKPLVVGHASVAVASAAGSPLPVAGTMRDLRFGGRLNPTIARGAVAVSDPVALSVPSGTDLLVSVFTPLGAGPATDHPLATQVSYFANDGTDHAADTDGAAFSSTTTAWYYVDEVDVRAPEVPGSVVAFGDSITDGYQSTTSANHRYPDWLAARLERLPRRLQRGVLNAGIGSNRILIDSGPSFPSGGTSMLQRVDTDVLARAGVRSLIVLGGINDIGAVPYETDPAALAAGLRQLAERAHLSGLRVVVGTVLPWGDTAAYTPEREAVREALNAWIRTAGCFDGVVDFDRLLRDPADAHRLDPTYDSGDHIHPNDAGYRVMADAVPIGLL